MPEILSREKNRGIREKPIYGAAQTEIEFARREDGHQCQKKNNRRRRPRGEVPRQRQEGGPGERGGDGTILETVGRPLL